jgi:DNA adenine methylase
VPEAVKPFLKWPGGKRWILPHIRDLLAGHTFDTYIEPFLGGGAVFFGLRPEKAVLSDINLDLIITYRKVKESPLEILDRLKALAVDAATYHRLREWKPTSEIDRAVRFLYLNRTAFAGMYRLNRQGRFNVPFGGGQRTPEPLWNHNLLLEASAALSNAKILSDDFEATIRTAGEGDFVYCDPTYTVAHNNNGFIRYNERNFSWDDQRRLARAAAQAAERGAIVLVSNGVHQEIRDLYPTARIQLLDRLTLLCPRPNKRGNTQEYLFVLGR